jgi:hypothetical protein
VTAKQKHTLFEIVRNAFTSRQEWLRKLVDPRRDLDSECGYPKSLSIQDYYQLWLRGDMAARVVSVIPEETWSQDPDVYETEDEEETEFETAWLELNKRMSIFSYLCRADILSGIGRFGVVLIGLDDGEPLDLPVSGMMLEADEGGEGSAQERQLLFLRPLDESLVTVKALETDFTNPRYGQPLSYRIQFADTSLESSITKSVDVHWSRIIHIADNRANSEIFGIPRMERVFNRLLDLRKITGGSGEMFWKGGFPGYSLETAPSKDGEDIELDVDATKKQMEDYMNGLQRYIATVGLQVKSLAVEIADPRPHVEVQLRAIAAALGVPWRVFVGSEAAQLASEQDTKTWNRRLTRRRLDYVNPFIVRPFIERLVAVGVLPPLAEENSLCVDWPDLNSPSDLEQADVASKRTDALAKYVQSGVDTLMPPFLYLTLILGMDDEEARAVVDAAEEQIGEEEGGLLGRANPEPEIPLGPNGLPLVPAGANGKPKPAAKPFPPARR